MLPTSAAHPPIFSRRRRTTSRFLAASGSGSSLQQRPACTPACQAGVLASSSRSSSTRCWRSRPSRPPCQVNGSSRRRGYGIVQALSLGTAHPLLTWDMTAQQRCSLEAARMRQPLPQIPRLPSRQPRPTPPSLPAADAAAAARLMLRATVATGRPGQEARRPWTALASRGSRSEVALATATTAQHPNERPASPVHLRHQASTSS